MSAFITNYLKDYHNVEDEQFYTILCEMYRLDIIEKIKIESLIENGFFKCVLHLLQDEYVFPKDPIHIATINNQYYILHLLCIFQFEVNFKTIELAIMKGFQKCLHLLFQYVTDPCYIQEFKQTFTFTPTHASLACKFHRNDILTFILINKCEIDTITLYTAVERSSWDCLQLCLESLNMEQTISLLDNNILSILNHKLQQIECNDDYTYLSNSKYWIDKLSHLAIYFEDFTEYQHISKMLTK